MIAYPPPKEVPRPRRKPRAATPSPIPPALLALIGVVTVFHDGTDAQVRLIFDTTAEAPVDVGAADPGKWSARLGDVLYGGSVLTAVAFDEATLDLVASGPDAGDSNVAYSNAPSDIADTLGRQLAALVFPVS